MGMCTQVVRQDIKEVFQLSDSMIDDLKPQLSFWGARYVTSPNHDGTLLLASVISSVVAKMPNPRECFVFEIEEMKGLVNRVHTICQESDRQVRESNFLTRLFVYLRSFIEEFPREDFLKAYQLVNPSKSNYDEFLKSFDELFKSKAG